ncbi:MAG: type II toxin-antitoxin system RelE/ParE family toxin [Verrucomicrobia bacterium]|nr:type II toxin-antitoxin system RelE/ParE family toxin [Verrucomicrobiota bacterium]MDA1005565.1 type II toxin-antitoxin system RelE/ParE family toxin [Verrucomicrobiota bacterium]
MEVRFHQLVQRDLHEILTYYELQSGRELADQFYSEFLKLVQKAQDQPKHFHLDPSGLRRCNITKYNHHFLYRIKSDHIRIQVLKHNHRHPGFGLARKP